MFHFVICDDNLTFLDKLSVSLENIFAKYNYDAIVSFKTDNGDNLLEYINANKIDVLFLDINLKCGKSGLEIAELVRQKNKNAYLIFTTGHLEYAMLAYKFKTFDYIAKPFTPERLEDTVIRLFDDIQGMPSKYLKIDNKNTFVDANEIEYIKRNGMKLLFHTPFNDYESYTSFVKLQDSLSSNFIRCHKSCIVNMNKIQNVDFVENRIYFPNNSFCEIGPKYKKNLIGVFDNYGLT